MNVFMSCKWQSCKASVFCIMLRTLTTNYDNLMETSVLHMKSEIWSLDFSSEQWIRSVSSCDVFTEILLSLCRETFLGRFMSFLLIKYCKFLRSCDRCYLQCFEVMCFLWSSKDTLHYFHGSFQMKVMKQLRCHKQAL